MMKRIVAVALGLIACILLPPPLHAEWEDAGTALDGGISGPNTARILPDGGGGWYVAWGHGDPSDLRTVWLTRVLGNGAIAPTWPAPMIFGPPWVITDLALAPDGTGGCLLAWSAGWQVHVRRVLPSGVTADGWDPGGDLPYRFTMAPVLPRVVSDDSQGAFVSWWGNYDPADLNGPWLSLARLDSRGGLAAGWPSDPSAPRETAPNPGFDSDMISDGSGGAYLAWLDVIPHVLRVDANGAARAGWSAGGLPAGAGAVGTYYGPRLVPTPDGTIVTWLRPVIAPSEQLLGLGGIVAQGVSAAGTITPGWPTDGLLLSGGADTVTSPQACSDGADGAFIAWLERLPSEPRRIRVTRVRSDGTLASGWPVGGLAVTDPASILVPHLAYESDPATEQGFAIAPDGAGGVLVAWSDRARPFGPPYPGPPHVRVRRVAGDGSFPEGWPASVPLVLPEIGSRELRAIAPDGLGGAVVASVDASDSLWLTPMPHDGIIGKVIRSASGGIASGHVSLDWIVADPSLHFRVERSIDSGPWVGRAGADPGSDGSIRYGENVPAGATTLAYRIAWTHGGSDVAGGEVPLVVPPAPRFALGPVAPNPAGSSATLRFSLRANEPAMLEMLDVAGRRVRSQSYASGTGGEQVWEFATLDALPAGMYLIRLTQGADRAVTRVVVIR